MKRAISLILILILICALFLSACSSGSESKESERFQLVCSQGSQMSTEITVYLDTETGEQYAIFKRGYGCSVCQLETNNFKED
jgi:ABC-type glycerol-3-phosphate transport system substrate-binding protein